jgi:hypothetical protein
LPHGLARTLGRGEGADGLGVAVDLQEHPALDVAVVAPVGGVEAEHQPLAGEVHDHVELVDHLGRALDEDQRLDPLAGAADEVDPLADAEGGDLAHAAEVQDQGLALDGGGELLAVEGLIDGPLEPEAGDRAVGELLDLELRLVHHAFPGAPKK